ncbi:uncharacterized protein M421DRAFT_423738 [Didymella exigua CBS 183.55]|uniref:Uncharacterized protein n=1 Tax=Didymella exigua CBS 183.55 TaxID=1150837 RepID=A0A6A5RB09_9PLEO|nr:uncharacterized protein M421DRAFT_423738 [Didymella exigua CBS 183.55]KAF1925421.1 hypothetical protein M421DRAFT_423738 [Didymella exigua CBS 183.55]
MNDLENNNETLEAKNKALEEENLTQLAELLRLSGFEEKVLQLREALAIKKQADRETRQQQLKHALEKQTKYQQIIATLSRGGQAGEARVGVMEIEGNDHMVKQNMHSVHVLFAQTHRNALNDEE